uniref:Tetratricopeptide repeat domain 17 n=1 Tax=Electrophorus electricus TaxID=8005 RepID=A0AAY5EZ98_ELEEL
MADDKGGSRGNSCSNKLWKASARGRMFVFICILLVESGQSTTHWVVTEDGKIQQQVDSPLNLKHPHHLVLFMQQETRVNYLKKLEKQLVAQKIHIEENEDRDTGLEQRHYKEDADCVTAKVPLGDLDLYDGTFISLESKGIIPEDYVDYMLPLPPDLEKPDCAEILELHYSIHAFQHLRGVQESINLTSPLLSKDDPIFASVSHKLGLLRVTIQDIVFALPFAISHVQNSSSWVLYNLASFYWRMKNEPKRAVDCVIRALHFSPRQHKDVALVNMANILHRAHFSADAAILAHAALDLTTDLLTSHYTLGNIYAMLGEYNHSVLCYEQALQAQPAFEQALRRKHAVLCQQKLEQRLEAQHRSLQRTLNELKEYQKQHDHYLRQQSMLDKHKLMQEEQILRNIIHETQMAKEAQLGNHQMCHLGHQQYSLFCPFDLPVRYHRGELFENVHHIQFGEEVSIASGVSLVSELSMNESRSPEPYSSHLCLRCTCVAKKETHSVLWPRRSDCAQLYPSIPPAHLLPTFFLPPESLESTEPPDCSSKVQFSDSNHLGSVAWALEGKDLPDQHASVPRWLLQNEAGLFWRARGNGTRALQCLRQALHSAPPQHRDVPLVNAANVLLHHGLHHEAQDLLQRALELNASEPHTLLSVVSVRLAQGNVSGALALFRHALSLSASCTQCHASLPLLRCLQFYPFLYNLQRQPCQCEYSHHHRLLQLASASKGDVELEDWDSSTDGNGQETGSSDAMHGSAPENSLLFESKDTLAELIGAFEGALDVSGKRGDLRGIRVLKNDRVMGARGGGSCFGNCEDDDGAEWITFQVKRMRKPKAESLEGWAGEEEFHQSESLPGHSILEISGPTIPSPGPAGRRRDFNSLGWPGPEECQRTRRVDLTTVASTWLAVSAKNIDITEHIDFATPLQEPEAEPVCSANLPASMHTLDHLGGVANRGSIHYTGESQLREVLQNLGKDKFSQQSFEQVGTRIAKVLEKNQTSWVLSSMAALYWRVKGQGKKAIDCLRQALTYAPHHMKDVPLISLANIFQNARLWEDALTVARMAVEIAPHFVVNHFTLANVYIAMEEFEKAMRWYESTLKLQPEFAPAKDRLRTIQCYLLTKKDRRAP